MIRYFHFITSDMKTNTCEKKEEIWLNLMTNTPTLTEKSKKRDNIKNATKNFDYTTIADRLRTDLGRSVGGTAVTKLVWLNRFTSAQPSH